MVNIKKINYIVLILTFLSCSSQARAGETWDDLRDSLMLKPALTFDYQVPQINARSGDDFSNKTIGNQLKKFENMVIGMSFRLHKYWGVDINWSRFSKESSYLSNYNTALSKKSQLSITNYNIASLFYFPILGDSKLEGFGAVGISDMYGKFQADIPNVGFMQDQKHEATWLYGAGLQYSPYDLNMSFRLYMQHYNTKLPGANGSILVYRLGMVKYF